MPCIWEAEGAPEAEGLSLWMLDANISSKLVAFQCTYKMHYIWALRGYPYNTRRICTNPIDPIGVWTPPCTAAGRKGQEQLHFIARR